MQNQHKIYNSLIGIRFFFFLFVFFFHLFGMMGIRETLCGGVFENTGRFAVNGFFVLSGYLYALQKKPDWRYRIVCKRRIKTFLQKNYFWHLVFLVFGLPFSIWAIKLGNESITGLLVKLLLCLSLTQTIIPQTSYVLAINSVSWYLSTSFLMIPLAIFIERWIDARYQKWGKRKFYIAFVIVYSVQIILGGIVNFVPYGLLILYYSFFIRIFDYTIGFLLGKYYERRYGNSTIPTGIWSILSLLVLILILLGRKRIPGFFNQGIIFTPISCGLILGSCIDKTWINRLFSTRFFVFLGKLSGYLFISHFVICEYILRMLDIVHIDNTMFVIILCLGVSLICAKIMQSLTKYKVLKKKKQYGGL